jgi:hypothetical protein
MKAAADRGVPVIHWILDHPASRWQEFFMSTAENSRFLLNSGYSADYFGKYCLPDSRTGTMGGVGPSRRSRIATLSRKAFAEREINCLIPISLRQIAGTPEEIGQEISLLPEALSQAVASAAAAARFDLSDPLERHLAAALALDKTGASNSEFNVCMRLLQASVQVFRRQKIFEIAREYPVLIQSDPSAAPLLAGGAADRAENVAMADTLLRMPRCRAILSISPLNDMIHDRTMNAVNAGCVAIVEDNAAHRRLFEDSRNALFFRYNDDSLRACFELVCGGTPKAYAIAQGGFRLRKCPELRFGEFHNMLRLAEA